MRLNRTAALTLSLLCWACDDAATAGGSGDAARADAARLDAALTDAVPPDAARPDSSSPDAAPLDAGSADASRDGGSLDGDVDQGLPQDAEVPRPDVGPLDGPWCDPRLNARACQAGQFCVHVPGELPHQGRCQAGEGCRPGVAADCPDPARPYCHLKGGSTVCSAVGTLRASESCLDANGIPLPCQDGLLCDNAVCVAACVPGQPSECPDEGRCADLTSATGIAGGLCAPRGCNWFTGAGCDAGEKCHYAIRNDGVLVGSCMPAHGANIEGAPCSFFPEGGDNCAQGLLCVGPPDRDRYCRILCDKGGYEAPCPANKACTGRLATSDGVVASYGICETNQ